MSEFERVVVARHEALARNQGESYAIGGLLAAVEEGPRPDKTDTSTGRSMESTTTSRRDPANYDPGSGRGSYKRPGAAEALRGLEGGRPFDDAVVSIGAPYTPHIGRWGYPGAEAAHRGGGEALRADQAENVRDAEAVR